MDTHFDVVILGAGLTGLSTSYYLNKAGLKIKVIDIKPNVGGVISTRQKNGFLFESGPNTGILGSTEIAELFEELQPDCQIELGNNNMTKRFILHKAKWQPLPAGLKQAITTPLFSFRDKLRILGEPFRKAGKDENETLAGLVKRRMGKSFLDYAIDPFILGVYAGDPSYLVTKYALPKLYNLEQTYGSFIGGSVRKMFVTKTEAEKKATRKIFTIKGGLGQLINSLYQKVGADNFMLGVKNITINEGETGFTIDFVDENEQAVQITANKVVTTIPAFNLNEVLPFVEQKLLADVQNVYYAPVVEVAIGFNKWKGIPLDGFGGLIPYVENRDILGVMYMSSLFENRAPKEGALISVFIGGARKPGLTQLSDDEIKALVKREFKELMGVNDFNPDLFEISWHLRAIPQYGKESKERFEAVDKIQSNFKGLLIGGNLHGGIGMADRVKQGKLLADTVINGLM